MLKRCGKEEENDLEEENRKLLEEQEKLQMELRKTSDGNFVCMHKSRKRSMIFYAVTFHCFP